VDQVLFLGETTEYSLKTEAGQTLIARAACGIGGVEHKRGELMDVGFKLSDAVSLFE
jgi:putative spermidine/putrescine transport system ATP-binding protein